MIARKNKIDAEIEKMIELGKKNGSINMEEASERFSRLNAKPEEIDGILLKLRESGVKIIENSGGKTNQDIEDLLNDMSLDDPVKMYLKDIDKVFFIVIAVIVAVAVAIYFLIPVFNKKQYQERRDNLRMREEKLKANAPNMFAASNAAVEQVDSDGVVAQEQAEQPANSQQDVDKL